jgi:hypothetical protein
MSMSNAAETALLQLLFQNAAWTGIGNAGGLLPSSVPGSLYVRLHSADPGEAGTQATSEISYTGYAAVAVARSAGGFTVSGDTVSIAATVQFGECTAGTATAVWFTVGMDPTGAGQVLYRGQLNDSRSISAGITPLFNPGALSGTVN